MQDRKDFEEWYGSSPEFGKYVYVDPIVQARWEAWKGALERYSWQPIESAPKDGTRVLLSKLGAMHTAFYRNGGWECGNLHYFNSPTHWMPLPAPPVQEGAE